MHFDPSDDLEGNAKNENSPCRAAVRIRAAKALWGDGAHHLLPDRGLVELGHDVTLFASGDTNTSARLVPCRERALRLDPRPLKSEIAAHLSMLDEVRKRADDFDIIHFHLSHFLHFPVLRAYAAADGDDAAWQAGLCRSGAGL